MVIQEVEYASKKAAVAAEAGGGQETLERSLKFFCTTILAVGDEWKYLPQTRRAVTARGQFTARGHGARSVHGARSRRAVSSRRAVTARDRSRTIIKTEAEKVKIGERRTESR